MKRCATQLDNAADIMEAADGDDLKSNCCRTPLRPLHIDGLPILSFFKITHN